MGFGFSGSTNLTKRKDGTISNSTKSCEIRKCNGENYYVAYSYKEKIALVNFKKKYILFNDEKFSPTTTSHQRAVQSKMASLFPDFKTYYISATSINSYDFSLKWFQTTSERVIFDSYLEDYFKAVYPRGHKRILAAIKKKQDEKIKAEKEAKSKAGKIKRLEKKLEVLDYPTTEKIKAALEKYKELTKSDRWLSVSVLVRPGVSWDKFNELEELDGLNWSLWKKFKVSNLDGPTDTLRRFIEEGCHHDLNYSLNPKNTREHWPLVKEFKDTALKGWATQKYIEGMEKLEKLNLFHDLGNDETGEAIA